MDRHTSLLAAAALMCFSFAAVAADPPAADLEDLLRQGRYHLIKKGDSPRELAAWALGQYHLRPGKAGAEAAKQAHEKGDALGSFVLLLCHRTGAGVARDPAVEAGLNFDLREALLKKQTRTPLESYMLAHTTAGDREGKFAEKGPAARAVAKSEHGKRCAQWLAEAMKGEFAQAIHERALELQERRKLPEAGKLHDQAGALGLAAGSRYGGLFRVIIDLDEASVADGIKMTRDAVAGGDAYAMINMGMFHSQGRGVEADSKKGQEYLTQASKTGHWMGEMEMGVALLTGAYELKTDQAAGKKWLQQSISHGNAEALDFMARAYVKGFGVAADGRAAVRFAEAAYRQGRVDAIQTLLYIYDEGAPGVEADEALAELWESVADDAILARESVEGRELLERVEKIDPFQLKVE